MVGLHFTFGLLACVVYVAVAIAAAAAFRVAERPNDRLRWGAIAILFICVAIWRGSGLELYLTSEMRRTLLQDGLYEKRRDLQRPLAALAVVVISSILYLFYLKRPLGKGRPRDWSRFWAMVGVTVMMGVIAMRLISFHELDRFLYGPIRGNWILDLGSSLLVAFAALQFRKLTRFGISQEGAPRR